MSFILDALRKSEHERRRGSLPGVAQVPFALPRARLPFWVPVAIGALAVALAATGFAWWHSARSTQAGPSVAASALPPQAAVADELAPQRAPERPAASAAEPAPRAAAPARGGDAPQASTAAPPEQRTEALVTPASPPPAAPASRAERSSTAAATLPGPSALAAAGIHVPPLTLQLHVYDSDAAKRFVIVNGRRYSEGATLSEGPELLSIERRGVVLRQQGREFLLVPE